MMNTYNFNINNAVKVKLTDAGRKELKRQHDDLGIKKEYKEIPTDKDGYSSFQLHTLMNSFGHMMVMGVEPPFEITIRIHELLLKKQD